MSFSSTATTMLNDSSSSSSSSYTPTTSSAPPENDSFPARTARPIMSGETLVLAECNAPIDPSSANPGLATVSNQCISLQGRALLRLTKLSGSDGMHFRSGDTLQIECGLGLILIGHSFSKYLSWKNDKTGSTKAVFRLEGLPDGALLHSQTPFRLASVRWHGCHLGKEDKPTMSLSRSNSSPNGTVLPPTSHGCLVLSKATVMHLCALPARLSFNQDTRFAQIRDLLDRAFQSEANTQFAYVTQFRTVRSGRHKLRTVHMDKLSLCCADRELSRFQDHECSICLSAFETGEAVATLPCHGKHMFHAECIHQWLKKGRSSCPMCVCPLDDIVSEAYLDAGRAVNPISRVRRVASL